MADDVLGILEFFRREGRVIKDAPWSFAAAILIAGGVIWFAIDHLYIGKINSLEGALQLQDRRVADYQEKLKVASPEDAAKQLTELRTENAALKERATKAQAILDAIAERLPVTQWGAITGSDGRVGYQVMIPSTSNVLKYKETHKLMLVTYVPYADVDVVTDTAIEKSPLYTITGGPLAIVMAGQGKLRILPQTQTIAYSVVLFPNHFSPDQANTFGDIDRLGGKILGGGASGIAIARQVVPGLSPTGVNPPTAPSGNQSPKGTAQKKPQ